MQKLSQSQKVAKLLKENPKIKFTARQIAEKITEKHAEDYQDKRLNPIFENDKAFLQQIVAEIGAQKDQILKIDNHIFWQDKPRPRVYWYDPDKIDDTGIRADSEIPEDDDVVSVTKNSNTILEFDLYPVLIDYLKNEHKLYCQRIDEKRSKNSYGSGGNQWLHPDIVAIQPIDKEWNELIRTCVKHGSGQSVRLWSFEVKKELNGSNTRRCFFQAVSNSSWANEGYLVTTSISNSAVEQELRMLSALHGIGVILLNPENPSESEVLLPARSRAEVDWQSVDRIVKENDDFKDFIELVSTYYQTGRIRARDWNRIKG
ncbi:HrgA protein [candidate division KSB1 bacterium]|nr:HrgA protein [candidate division KSB1 bacterium]